MTGFILRRTLSMLVTFIVVSIVIFLMMHSIPGGPFDGYEMPLPDNIKQKLMAQLGLDRVVDVELPRIDDRHVEAGGDGVVEEHRVHRPADGLVAAEGE